MAIKVRPLDQDSQLIWDRFVHAMPAGTFFHRAGWAQVVQTAFRHTPHYVFAERDGVMTGVLPLVRVKTRLFGDTLISNPFCVYGGPLAADAESHAALVAHAEALMRQTGVSAMEFRHRDPVDEFRYRDPVDEFRHRDPVDSAAVDGWIDRPDLYVTFRKAISGDHDANMKAIPRKQRAMVRKGIQLGLTSEAGQDVRALHRVYAESVRNLGTPVFARRYFSVLMEVFGKDADVVTIRQDGTPVASVLNFYFRDEVLPYYGGGTAAARACAGNDFMYWDVMRRAADRGCRLFDFGRSKLGTGAYAFKHNWGFEASKLHYRFRLKPGETMPDHNPLNPKYALFIAAWKRLPLPVANAIGPFIVRGLG